MNNPEFNEESCPVPFPGSILGEARGLLWQAVSLVTAAWIALFHLSDPPAAPKLGPFTASDGEDNQLI